MKPFSTIKELISLRNSGQITADELFEFYQRRFATYDDKIGSALEIFSRESVFAEQNEKNKKEILHGIPGLIKNNICQSGRVTSCGSKILENYVAPYDATAITRLKEAGAS